MTAHQDSHGKRRRRWLRFRLRSLLVLITLVATILGLHHTYVRPYHDQQQAADALTAKGAALTWESAEPAWLANILRWVVPEDKLRDCVKLDAEHVGLEDADMLHVRHLRRLKRLYLARNPVTNAGLEHLSGLEYLQRLSLWGTKITNEGLRHVGQLPELRVLDIHHVQPQGFPPYGFGSAPAPKNWSGVRYPRTYPGKLSGECFEYLQGAPNLRAIYFSFALNDEDLARLAKLKNVRKRTLVLRNVTPQGLAHLSTARDLQAIVIRGASLGDVGLRDLDDLPRLKWLQLRGARATSAGWQSLATLQHLEDLSLDLCPLDKQALQAAGRLPQLKQLSLQLTGVNDQQVTFLSKLTNLESLDLRKTLVTADCLEHLASLKQLARLVIDCPLDDEAVHYLAQLPNLETISRGDRGYQPELYLTDAGMADLAKLSGLRNINIREANAGADIDGIDVPDGSGTISDEGVSTLLAGAGAGMLFITGQNLTTAGLRWSPDLSDWKYVRIQSAKPLAEMIAGPLGVGPGGAKFEYRRLNLTAPEGIGPRGVGLSFPDKPSQLELLHYMPDIRQLQIGVHNHYQTSEPDWDQLRLVPDLEVFEMDGYPASSWRLDATGIRRLGQMRDLQRLVIYLEHHLSADDFAPMANLDNLELAVLHFDGLNEAHLKALGRCRKLAVLEIFGNPPKVQSEQTVQAPVGIRHLVRLTQLAKLRLYGATNEDVASLAKLKTLERLLLAHTNIEAEALAPLKRLPNLKYLGVDVKEPTPECQQQVRRMLPNTVVRIH